MPVHDKATLWRNARSVNPIPGSARSSARPAWRTPAAWGLAGFGCGIVFWHFVGFWGFVSRIVFKPPEPASIAAQIGKSGGALDGRERETAPAPSALCVELRRSDSSRAVQAHPCVGNAALIKAGPLASRGDMASPRLQMLAPSVAGWTAQINGEREHEASPQ